MVRKWKGPTEAQRQLNPPNRLQRKPSIDHHGATTRCAGRSTSVALSRTPGAWSLGRAHLAGRVGPSRRASILHLIGRNPAGCIEFRLDFLATHLLGDIGNAHPQHADRSWPIARFVIYGKLDLIRLVDIDIEHLILPSVGSGSFRSGFDGILNLHNHECLGASGEPRAGSMVYILHSKDSHSQGASEGFAQVRRAQTFVYSERNQRNMR